MLAGVAVVVLVLGSPLVVRAAADTWSGTWARTELPGKHLFLTQTGSTVSGHYDWNDASGHLSGQVTGATLSGPFNETHYQGTYSVTLGAGHCRSAAVPARCFEGSADVTNKDTGFMGTSAFNGTCIAGPCLQNGATTAPATTVVSPPAAFGQAVSAPEPAPGDAAATSSPPLGQAAAVTEDVSGVTDADRVMFAAGQRICYENFTKAVLAGVEKSIQTGLGPEYKLVPDGNIPRALADLALCIEVVKFLVASAHASSAVAHDAAARCSIAGVRYSLSRKRQLTNMKLVSDLHVNCTRTAHGIMIHYSSGSKKPLASIVGRRLHFGVLRAKGDPLGGNLSFVFHKG